MDNQNVVFSWIVEELYSLNEKNSLASLQLDSIMVSTQNLAKGISNLKTDHEICINRLKDTLNNIHKKIKAMVVVSKTAMDNSTEDLKKLNEQAKDLQALTKVYLASQLASIKLIKMVFRKDLGCVW